MTMPQYGNCPHQGDGWCLKCVQEVTAERDELLEKIERITESWLREEKIWQDLDKDRYKYQKALEQIAGYPMLWGQDMYDIAAKALWIVDGPGA